MLDIYPDGSIMSSQRLTLNLGCKMNFRYFPFDGQWCPIIIESFGYRTHQLEVLWPGI